MRYNLPAMARAQGKRRNIALRPIQPTKVQATELAAIIAPAWRVWAEAKDRIMAGYDPAPLTDGLTRDSLSDITRAIEDTGRDFLRRLVVDITPALSRWAVRVERWHRGKWAAAIKAGTDVDLSMMLLASDQAETVEGFIARNVALVRNISDQAQARISDAIFRGYQDRRPAREVAKEITEAVGMGRDRAVRVAADQNAKLSAQLDRERQAEAGIEQYKWRHSGKLHPRAVHKARDGKIYNLNEPAGDTPGQAPYCGCRAQAWIALLDEVD